MSNTFFCQGCKRELTGAIELMFSNDGDYSYIVSRDTTDCNWRRCRGCKSILCKKCDDKQLLYCCDEGRIMARERAGAALDPQGAQTSEINPQPAP